MHLNAHERRARLGAARLMLLYTPEACRAAAPLVVLERALPFVDVVQVRIKEPGLGTSPARALLETTRAVLALRARLALPVLVLVNDRVDVARALAAEGCDGVHVGADDTPPALARAELGPEALLGLSTHSAADVVAAGDEPLDYLGFGPVHASRTKGYARGLGSEAAWIAAQATPLPLFPIGGIDASNADELAEIGRAAVSSAVLAAQDPARAAAELVLLLTADA